MGMTTLRAWALRAQGVVQGGPWVPLAPVQDLQAQPRWLLIETD